jgi:hypothetical protein
MKTTPYIRQEKAIAAADTGSIRERWIYGLRVLRDTDAIAKAGGLKNGVADHLIAAAKSIGRKLSIREIQYRMQAARTYPTEVQIAQASARFESWSALIAADFPPFEAPEGEPPADHRTASERDHDRARALVDLIGEQSALFPLSDFEPVTTTLKELQDYADQQEDLTARFVAHGRKRRAYLDRLIEAAGNDLSLTWQEAHDRLDHAPPDVPDVFAA